MKEREEVPEKVDKLLSEINAEVLAVIAKRIKAIGKVSDEDMAVIRNLMIFYNEDMQSIEKKLAELTGKTAKEIEKAFTDSAKELGEDATKYYVAAGVTQLPFKENKALQNIVAAAVDKVTDELLNISKTTAMGIVVDGKFRPIREGYTLLLNKAILAVTTGATDFNTAMQKAMKELGESGVRVQYDSGYSRRLDSALRSNVHEGIRSMNRDVRKQQGEEFGADGVYIMPHGLCAPDHLPYQGREFTYEEFEKLNAVIPRPIATGQWNCGHIAYDVLVGGDLPYSKAELDEINNYSMEEVKWNGRRMSRYEATQKMRQAETRIRELKDVRAVYKKSGDALNVNRYDNYIDQAFKKYKARCKECGLKPRLDLIGK